jgi:hypothetical protein
LRIKSTVVNRSAKRILKYAAILGIVSGLVGVSTVTAGAAITSGATSASGLAGLPTSPQSSATLAAERVVFLKVIDAKSPTATYQSLDASDQALYAMALTHQVAKTLVSRSGQLTAAQAIALGLTPNAAEAKVTDQVAAKSGCWYKYLYVSWSDLTINDGNTWYQLNWCGSGGKVTSYHASDVGCSGATGSVCHGVYNEWADNVGWEVRYAIEWTFSNVLYWFSGQPCEQIRGGATGLNSTRGTCNLS